MTRRLRGRPGGLRKDGLCWGHGGTRGGRYGGEEPEQSAGGQSDLRTFFHFLLPERPRVEDLFPDRSRKDSRTWSAGLLCWLSERSRVCCHAW